MVFSYSVLNISALIASANNAMQMIHSKADNPTANPKMITQSIAAKWIFRFFSTRNAAIIPSVACLKLSVNFFMGYRFELNIFNLGKVITLILTNRLSYEKESEILGVMR